MANEKLKYSNVIAILNFLLNQIFFLHNIKLIFKLPSVQLI